MAGYCSIKKALKLTIIRPWTSINLTNCFDGLIQTSSCKINLNKSESYPLLYCHFQSLQRLPIADSGPLEEPIWPTSHMFDAPAMNESSIQ